MEQRTQGEPSHQAIQPPNNQPAQWVTAPACVKASDRGWVGPICGWVPRLWRTWSLEAHICLRGLQGWRQRWITKPMRSDICPNDQEHASDLVQSAQNVIVSTSWCTITSFFGFFLPHQHFTATYRDETNEIFESFSKKWVEKRVSKRWTHFTPQPC